ncbi:hypothetical protein HD_1646 [[Haemophilus] ducreyi 35000HP]|uniref:Uncharacterized protein n=1 Tax=Haemophilus ducreyi (strain 35000HP / ATCC 700724) TaxID=233412 RepID=Q7VL39_HAEDU|nr:hypothetical protein HD_1646 [[Haemophilus] ducreyi 35000HP]
MKYEMNLNKMLLFAKILPLSASFTNKAVTLRLLPQLLLID